MRIVLSAVAVLLVVATAIPLVPSEEWWVRALGFPRFQIAVLLTLVLVAFLFVYRPRRMRDNALLLALAVSIGHQTWRIFPYTPLASPEVISSARCPDPARLRLMVANVLMDNRRADDLLAFVQRHAPDLILTLETDDWWDEQLSALDGNYPFAIKHPLGNTYGLHLFSRLELGSPQVRFLLEDQVPSVQTGVRLPSGDWIGFFGLHPRPPKPQQDTEERDAEILIVAREVRSDGRPTVVAGDLNDVAWSHTTRLFQEISGMLDPRVGRGTFSSFHAGYPLLRWPLDHVFHDESFTLVEITRLPFFGSDHFPVLAELCLEPSAERRQEAPQAGEEDREEAQEAIDEGKSAD